MNRQANRQVRASIKAAQAPILTEQKVADARAAAAQEAMRGFSLAAGDMLTKSAPLAGVAYDQAAQAQGNLAGAYSHQVGDQMRSEIAANQALVDRLTPGGVAGGPDVNATTDAMYGLGGMIPGARNEEMSAAAIRSAAVQPSIEIARTVGEVHGAQVKQAEDDQQYVQQMLDIAAKAPELRQQIMQQLQQNELAKRNAWVQQQAQNMVQQRFNVSAGQAQQRINIEQRRMRIAERQGNARLALEAGNLRLSQQRQRAAVRQALINGQRIDSSASHAAGYLIDRNGDPILDKQGKRIAVKSGSAGGRGGANTGPGSTAYKEAYRYASSQYTAEGQPIATMPFVQMQRHLVRAYGVTRGQARKILVGLGLKPDGKRG